jgi:hypothetical protein
LTVAFVTPSTTTVARPNDGPTVATTAIARALRDSVAVAPVSVEPVYAPPQASGLFDAAQVPVQANPLLVSGYPATARTGPADQGAR